MKRWTGVRMPEELRHELRVQADKEGRSESELVRAATDLYLRVVSLRKWAVLQPDMIALIEEISQREKKKPEQILREAIWSKADGKERLVHLETIIGELMEVKGYAMVTAMNQVGKEAFEKAKGLVQSGAEVKRNEVMERVKRGAK